MESKGRTQLAFPNPISLAVEKRKDQAMQLLLMVVKHVHLIFSPAIATDVICPVCISPGMSQGEVCKKRTAESTIVQSSSHSSVPKAGSRASRRKQTATIANALTEIMIPVTLGPTSATGRLQNAEVIFCVAVGEFNKRVDFCDL